MTSYKMGFGIIDLEYRMIVEPFFDDVLITPERVKHLLCRICAAQQVLFPLCSGDQGLCQ